MKRLLHVTAAAALGIGACGGPPDDAVPLANLADVEERLQPPRERAVLLVFWATWCDPCIDEIPDLVDLQQALPEQLEIVSVSLDAFLKPPDEARGMVQAFLAKTPVPWDQLVYAGGPDELFDRFEMPGSIPYAILYGRDGDELDRFLGRVDRQRLRDRIEKRLSAD